VLSNSEKAVLLLHDLDVPYGTELLSGKVFPKLVKKSSYYSLLEFDKSDKKKEFERLSNIVELTADEIDNSYDQIKEHVWKPLIRKEIEKLFTEKVVWATNIKRTADTSKRRHILRGKQAVVNSKFKDVLNEYSALFQIIDRQKLYESCENGLFPWLDVNINSAQGTAVNRRMSVEAYLDNSHLLEERGILLEEMQNCLHHFCSKIKVLEEDLKRLMMDDDSSGDGEQGNCDISVIDPAVRGRMVLVKTAMLYYRREIEKALKAFECYFDPNSLCTGDLPEESDDEHNGSEHNESDTCPSDIEYDITREILMTDISFDFISTLGIELSRSFAFSECVMKEMNDEITILLPREYCQDRFAGANGSNACVVISLLMGFMVVTKKNLLMENFDCQQFCELLVPLFCGAVHTGNFLYEHYEARGFLTITEAISFLPSAITLNIEDEENILPSDFRNFIQKTSRIPSNSFSVMIVNGVAVSILPTKLGVLVIDTHSYDTYGGKLTFIDRLNIPDDNFPLFKDNEMAYCCVLNVKKDY